MSVSDDDLLARGRRLRDDPALVVLEGFHVLKHALRFGAEIELVISADPSGLDKLSQRLAPDISACITTLAQPSSAGVVTALSPHAPRTGVIAFARRAVIAGAGAEAAGGDRPLVALEDPRHPGNVGAVIRVAAAAGAAGVLTTGASDPWSAAALRGSAGLHFALPVWRASAIPDGPGRPLIAVDPGGEPLNAQTLPRNALLVFGTERDGLSPELIGRAGAALRSRCVRRLELNVATAVAVVLYAIPASAH